MSVSSLKTTLDNQLRDIENLEREYNELVIKRDELKATSELANLIKEQHKLKYRIGILERSIADELAAQKNTKTSKNNQTSTSVVSETNNTMSCAGQRKLTSKPQPNKNERSNYSISVTDTLESLFDRAIQAVYSDLPDAVVIITNSKVADYQCNSAMSIAQALKTKGQKANPNEVAQRIVANMEKIDLIEKNGSKRTGLH